MRNLSVLALSATILSACAAGDPSEERAAFVTQLGDDTVAVERFTRNANGLRAEVVLRVPQTSLRVYDVRFDEARRPISMVVETYDPASGLDGEPVEREEVDLSAGSGIPFIDYVHWPFELMLRQAHASEVDTVTIELVTRRRPLPFIFARLGDGRFTATHPTRGTMEIQADASGQLTTLDASKTTRALRVMRQTTIDIDALAREFAARDARGEAMGELSGRGELTTTVAGAEITVDWGRPLKRGREIFGALVPWGEVWRTGANQATHFSTSRALRAGDATIPAGTYTIFTVPRPDRWTLMVNKRTQINGQAYDPEEDLVRVEMQTRTLEETVEPFTILVEEADNGGVLRLRWDRTEAYLPFQVVN